MKKKSWKGSMTVEAAIVMPLFVIIVFSLIMITKFVYVHSLVQQGLVQTTKEVSSYSYLLQEILQVDDIHSHIQDVLKNNIQVTEIDGKIADFSKGLNGNNEAQQKILNEMLPDFGSYAGDFAAGSISALAFNSYMDLLGEGAGQAAKFLFPKYLGKDEAELNNLLLLLGVEGGLGGIRMQGSLPGRGDNITLDFVAAYRINLDPPLKFFLEGKTIIQRASCIPWIGE